MAQQTVKKDAPKETEQKIQTRYDRRMEARRQQREKEAKQQKITKITVSVIGIILVAAILASVAIPVIRKASVLNGTYVKIGDYELTELEYDYFYNSTVNNYMSTYSSILSYMGLNPSGDFESQQYTDNLTWKDMFDEMTVDQIKQTKALVDEAQKTGFVYNTDEDYAAFQEQIEGYATSEGMSLKEYYKQSFGEYATEKNVEAFIREGMLAGAYHNDLLEQNAPSKEEISAYYEENKQNYDRVDYRSFAFNAQLEENADEKAVDEAMKELKVKAEAMMKERSEGGDFEELCIENASEEDKANYEDAETEYSLSQGRSYAGIPAAISGWLYEEGRKEGDITVIEDESTHRYYVVEFVNRYFDEADNETISNTISGERTSDYVNTLAENYQVVDVKGNLKYLTIPEDTDKPEEDGESGADSEQEPNAETNADSEQESDAETDGGAEENSGSPSEEKTE